jgi:hypothetical protein
VPVGTDADVEIPSLKLIAKPMRENGLAEREGFEPSVPSKGYNGFRDRPDRPLRHLSVPLARRLGRRRLAQTSGPLNPNGSRPRRALKPWLLNNLQGRGLTSRGPWL